MSLSSSSNTQWIHDVFLNFRGEDTRKTFVSHLYVALSNAGINAFIDDKLPKGTELGPELVRVIQGSRISIVVFSTNYASSRWCLNELVKIMECRTTYGQLVRPIFYDVDPSDVRHQKGAFGERLKALAQKCLLEGTETQDVLRSWKSALTEIANIAGWDVMNCRSEGDLVKEIVRNIFGTLNMDLCPITEFPVGLDFRGQKVCEFINAQLGRVCASLCNFVHESIRDLRSHLLINLKDCASLSNLPGETYEFKSSETLILSDCSNIEKLEEDTALKLDDFIFPRLEYFSIICYIKLKPTPTIPNPLPCIRLFCGISISTSLVSMNIQNSDRGDLAPMLSNLPNLRSVLLQCDSEFQLSKQVTTILEDVNGVNFTELEIPSYTSQISKHPLRSYLIGIGSYQQVFSTLSNSISEGLETSESCDIFLPGDHHPYWFAHRGEGHSVNFTVPEDCRLKGMTLSVDYLSTPETTATNCLISVLMVNYTKYTIQMYKPRRVNFFDAVDWQGIISRFGSGDKVEIFVTFGHGLVVKKTAVYLLYDESIDMETDTVSKPPIKKVCGRKRKRGDMPESQLEQGLSDIRPKRGAHKPKRWTDYVFY